MQRSYILYSWGVCEITFSTVPLQCFVLTHSYSLLASSNPITIVISASIHEVDWCEHVHVPLLCHDTKQWGALTCLDRMPMPWDVSMTTLWALLNSQISSFYCPISLRVDPLVKPCRKGWMFPTYPHFLTPVICLYFSLPRFYQECVQVV